MDHTWMWVGFNLFVVLMLVLDLGVFHRKNHAVTIKEALIWSGVWISLALLFNYVIYLFMGKELALQFLTGYVIEKSLSIDNLFVFIMIFGFFNIKPQYQHKVLFWGILGALFMRAAFIFAGVALIHQFTWIIYVFGAFLIFTGIKMLFEQEKELEPEKNILIKLFRKLVPVTETMHEDRFFVRQNARLMATPLLVVLVLIEISDLIFAVDSIPAILAISSDTFIVYTSNVFAILGLRSLYFALAGVVNYFRFLKFGLAAILSFVGIKMLVSGVYHIPIMLSLGIILGLIFTSILASVLIPAKVPVKD